MITGTAILIGKILLMVILLGAMIFILLGIGHLFHHDDMNTLEETDLLKHDVEEKENVISEKSVFYNFLVKVTRTKDRDLHR